MATLTTGGCTARRLVPALPRDLALGGRVLGGGGQAQVHGLQHSRTPALRSPGRYHGYYFAIFPGPSLPLAPL